MTELQQQWADLALIPLLTILILYIDYGFFTYFLSLCTIISGIAIYHRQLYPKELTYERY